MRLYLVRHGQTEENLRHEVQGQLPGTLSSKGCQQAQALAEHFRKVPLQAILTSDLNRTVQTSAYVVKYHHLTPQELPLLREQHYGIYQGKIMHDLSPAAPGGKEPIVSPPQGESAEDVFARAHEFWAYLKENFTDQAILAVSHGVFLSILLWVVKDKPLPTKPTVDIDNASVTLVSGDEISGYHLDIVNDTSHLSSTLNT